MTRDVSSNPASLILTDRRFAEGVARIAAAYLKHNLVAAAELPELIHTIQGALRHVIVGANLPTSLTPAVPIKKSVGDDFVICLEDGKRLKMLKRYLRTHHKMTPAEYRKKWDLPHDYPMVAPAYARLRASFAKKIGLGTLPVANRGRKRQKRTK